VVKFESKWQQESHLSQSLSSPLLNANDVRMSRLEAQDYKARTRRTGLEKLKAMFKSCYKLIEEQQTLAKQVVERGNST
jgi:hypothetical protein